MEEQEIASVIIQIADKLGIAVSEISRIFVEAQPKIAIINIIMTLFVALVPTIIFVIVWQYYFNKEKIKYASISRTDENVIGPSVCILLIALVICFFIALMLSDSFYRLLVPEYMGLKDMIHTFATIT